MGSVKSGLLALAVTGMLGTAVVVGCSANGSSADVSEDEAGTDPTSGSTASLPPQSPEPPPPPGVDSGHDSGKKDSGYDAGPPPPNPGDPCTKVDTLATKPCGACGTAQAICQGDADAGTLKWSEYGQCMGEIAGGCTPGTMGTCGNCGTQTCSKYCAWGSCSEPPGACKAGSTDYTAAGCTAPNTYRSRSCSATCSYSSFSTTCAAPNNPNKMSISGTINGTATSNWALSPANVGDVLQTGSCPGTVDTFNSPAQFVAVEVQNPTAKTATITLWSQQAPGGPASLDTIMWAYNKTLPPPDDTALTACDYGVADGCPTGVTCAGAASSFDWAGISSVTLAPGASVLVYTAGFSSSVTGAFQLAAKTTDLK